MKWPRPDPPEWALAAGLPAPTAKEDFPAYVTRLGLDLDVLTEDLDERAVDMLNVRLASALILAAPEYFRHYLDERRAAARG
jgi:hypothetical protein